MGRVLTLLYHRVNCLKKDIQMLAVEPENFYAQMQYLKQNYKIVKFDEDWDKFEQDAVCITFDDGYFDNYQNAVPIFSDIPERKTVPICIESRLYLSFGKPCAARDFELFYRSTLRQIISIHLSH